MVKQAADLTIKVGVDSAELKQGLDQLDRKFDKFKKDNENVGKSITTAWMKVAGAVAAVVGALKTAEKVINSTQLTSDKYTAAMEGAKEATNAFFTAIATGDLTGFIKDLGDAYKAGKEYAEQLDDIADRTRSVTVLSKEAQLQIEKQKGILRSGTIDEQKKAAAEIKRITEADFDRQEKLAIQALDAEKGRLMTKHHLNEQQSQDIIDYIKNYQALSKEQYDSIQLAVNAKEKLDKYLGAIGAFKESNQYKRLNERYQESISGLSDQERAYVEMGSVANKVMDAQRDKIAEVIGNWYDAQKALQVYINTADRGLARIKGKESKVSVPADTKFNEDTGIEDWMTMPSNTPVIPVKPQVLPEMLQGLESSLSGVRTEMEGITQKTDDLYKSLANVLTNGVFALTDAFGELFASTEDGFKSIVNVALSAGKQIIDTLLAQAIAGMIAGESKKGLLGLFTASVGIAGLMALWNSNVSKFAGGGIVPGNSYFGDRVPVLANSGEMVLNGSQQRQLFNAINKGNLGGQVTFRIEGDTLVGILNKMNKINGLR